MQQIIENHWYQKDKFVIRLLLNLFLIPISLIFYLITKIRYFCYQTSILKSYKLPVPVVIVGNITVGGSGKTPLTKHIAKELARNNIKVGIILRGYKSSALIPQIVTKNDDVTQVGDEALIYANNNIPVAIGRNRYQAGLVLLKEHPDIQIILSDDGMQHYRLQRDFEIAVIDISRILGNRFTIPNGPLRETVNRLKKTNAIVVNTQERITSSWFYNNLKLSHIDLQNQLLLSQKLVLYRIYNPITKEVLLISAAKNKNIVAIAAIGNPKRFFNFIENSGVVLSHTIEFPDHHFYLHSDIPTNYDIILTSDKDYTKLAKFNNNIIWVVEVSSLLSNESLVNKIMELK